MPRSTVSGKADPTSGRLIKLRAAYGELGQTLTSDTLLDLDYQCQCVQLYFLRYLGEVVPNHAGMDMTAAGADLVKLLS